MRGRGALSPVRARVAGRLRRALLRLSRGRRPGAAAAARRLALPLRAGGRAPRRRGSAHQLPGGHHLLVARNTIVLVAIWFPPRWLPLVAYRQAGWLWHAARERRLAIHLRGLAAALPLLPAALGARASLRARARREARCRSRSWCRPGPSGGRQPAVTDPVARTCHRRNLPGGTSDHRRAGRAPLKAASTRPFSAHRAEYRLCATMLGDGQVLDLGCGTGHSWQELSPRETVGVDIDAAALAGQQRRDPARRHALAAVREDASFASTRSRSSRSSTLPRPERVLAEVARSSE